MNSLYLNVPITAVRGNRETRRAVYERLGYYMNMRVTVAKKMPATFPPFMVQAALAQCDEMIAFYKDLNETF